MSNALTTVTNAGDYWVKAEITSNWINAVNAEVDAAASGWTAQKISAQKATRKPRFFGTADTSDTAHKESDTVRWFKITVNKADIDFSGVTWSASELEFNNTNQSVTIVSGLPDFLTVKSYNAGATGRLVNSYTAKVTDWNITDTAKAANYNVPTSTTELDKISYLTHSWQITKKKIEVDWQLPGKETSSGSGIFIPNLKDDTTVSIEYTYFASNGITPKTIAEIESEYSITERKTYQVCAKLRSSGATYNASNSVLMESGRDVTTSGARRSFTTGDTKIPVTVRVSPDHVTYNGAAQPVTIVVDGASLTAADFVVTYTMKSGAAIPAGKADSSGVPIGAGEYKAKIALNSSQEGTYAITGDTEFDYTIDKATYDLSGFQWLDESNVQYSAPYKWEEGVSHTLRYDGTLPSGLTFAYSEATKDNVTGSNVGKYPIVVEFTNGDPDNYEIPENVEFEWEIVAGTLDLSAVRWNYDNNFVFKIEGGITVEYEVYLENLPAELAPLIRYGGDTGKRFTAGRYTTTFTVDESDPMYKNFGTLTFPEAATSSLPWEIKALTFEKPNALQTETYRDEGYTFDDIAGFPAGWEEYFDVTVKDSDEIDVPLVDGAIKLVNVDNYRVIINFKSNLNASAGGSADNVTWSDGGLLPCQVAFRLQQLVLALNGWTERGGNIRPRLDAEASVLPQIEKYFDTVVVNTETDEEVPSATALGWETVYTIALRLKPEYAGNVAVEYMGTQGDSTAPYAFMTDVDPTAPPPTNFYRKPTDEEAHVYYRYTGKEVAFKLGAWFVEEKMQILARAGSAESLLKGTEEGDYIVRVGFKKGARSAWEPASAVPADRAPVTITFTISKDAKLGDRFILKDGITVPFAFLYDDFSDVGAIEDYAFNADKLAYISRLSLGDTLSALLSQFENGADITVYDLDGTTVITDLETVVATGMYLRLMDGDTMLNQLILAVLGEITGDGIINLKDKAQLNSYTLGTTKLAPAQLLASDITGDGIINLKDKAQLNSYTLGTNALPVTPIIVPAASSVSEVVENAEVMETPVHVSIVSVSEVAETELEHATFPKVAKANYPHQSAKGADSFPLMCKGEAKRKEIF